MISKRWGWIFLHTIYEILSVSLLLNEWLHQRDVPFFFLAGNFVVLKTCHVLQILWYYQLLGAWGSFLAHELGWEKGFSAPGSQEKMELKGLWGSAKSPHLLPLHPRNLGQNRQSKCPKPKVAHTKIFRKIASPGYMQDIPNPVSASFHIRSLFYHPYSTSVAQSPYILLQKPVSHLSSLMPKL